MVAVVISFVSLVIALVTAVYTRHSVDVAKQANRIAVHHERLKIYKALLSHISALSARGVAIGQDEVWQFFEPARLSKFYFQPAQAEKMLKIFNDSVVLISKKTEWEEYRSTDTETFQMLVRETHALHRATRDAACALAEEIEPSLVINNA